MCARPRHSDGGLDFEEKPQRLGFWQKTVASHGNYILSNPARLWKNQGSVGGDPGKSRKEATEGL
jgi:hypothetical protein